MRGMRRETPSGPCSGHSGADPVARQVVDGGDAAFMVYFARACNSASGGRAAQPAAYGQSPLYSIALAVIVIEGGFHLFDRCESSALLSS